MVASLFVYYKFGSFLGLCHIVTSYIFRQYIFSIIIYDEFEIYILREFVEITYYTNILCTYFTKTMLEYIGSSNKFLLVL